MLKKLPEKWCVKGTKCKTVQEFFLTYRDNEIKDFVSHRSYEDWYFFSEAIADMGEKIYCDYKIKRKYKKISFDDFKRLVLGETVNNEMGVEIW